MLRQELFDPAVIDSANKGSDREVITRGAVNIHNGMTVHLITLGSQNSELVAISGHCYNYHICNDIHSIGYQTMLSRSKESRVLPFEWLRDFFSSSSTATL
jgi:hypothetical protein